MQNMTVLFIICYKTLQNSDLLSQTKSFKSFHPVKLEYHAVCNSIAWLLLKVHSFDQDGLIHSSLYGSEQIGCFCFPISISKESSFKTRRIKRNSKRTQNKPKKTQQKTVAGFLLWQIRVTGWPEAGKKKDWSPPISLFPYCKLLVVFASLSKRVTLSIQVLYVFPGSVCLDHWAFGSHPATWWNSLWFPVM